MITKEAIHWVVWRDTLIQRIGELRRALGDQTRHPRFLETAHGRGFRFIAQLGVGAPEEASEGLDEASSGSPSESSDAALPVVGRGRALARLHECLRRSRRGARQLVFITGEAGIGKTTLAEEFLRSPAVLGCGIGSWVLGGLQGGGV